jgi:RNA polymerase sigma-70 factor, ECF subfamily
MEVQNINAVDAEYLTTLESALAGDREALGRLLSGLTDQLHYVAFRVLESHEDAEDAVQDGLLAAVRHVKTFEGRAHFSTWLTRVVINAALMRRRKMRAHATTSIDQHSSNESELCVADKIADPGPNPEEAYTRQERLTIIKQWFETLPALYRSTLWLRDVEGMTTQEAAEALQVSEGTLKSRLHRARVELSKRLRDAPGCSHSHESRRLQEIENSERNPGIKCPQRHVPDS